MPRRSTVPAARIAVENPAPIRPGGAFVLYWMIAARRAAWNYGLQRALEWARELDRPLLVLEALRCGYPWASDRLHAFVLQGMAANRRDLDRPGVRHYAYVEPAPGAGSGLLQALAERAAVVVTDQFPCFFLPRMVRAAAPRLPVRVESVDSNGLLPLGAAPRAFGTAVAFRRFLHQNLRSHLQEPPAAAPLRGLRLAGTPRLPRSVTARWPEASSSQLEGQAASLARLPIDHTLPPVAALCGGSAAGRARLAAFLERLPRYDRDRNDPDLDATSGLSPWLHFGHLAVHEVFAAVAAREAWSVGDLAPAGRGQRSGWWGMGPAAEAFLDQLVTWRELGLNAAAHLPGFDRYETLPAWAQRTLAEHAGDRRPDLYTLAQLEAAETHDPLWNAAQRQLRREGRIHNYLRMLWGKKILEWTASPQAALGALVHLNDRLALDGRDPNSYSGIFWILGRYDRPWGPERPIFGTVRYMSSQNTARKLHVKEYLRRWGA